MSSVNQMKFGLWEIFAFISERERPEAAKAAFMILEFGKHRRRRIRSTIIITILITKQLKTNMIEKEKVIHSFIHSD